MVSAFGMRGGGVANVSGAVPVLVMEAEGEGDVEDLREKEGGERDGIRGGVEGEWDCPLVDSLSEGSLGKEGGATCL